jgi:eukaryotic-like serine/threonine-protein kinase
MKLGSFADPPRALPAATWSKQPALALLRFALLLLAVCLAPPAQADTVQPVEGSASAKDGVRPDTLLLSDFSNATGDESLEGVLSEALRMELDQSPYFRVLPERRVREALRALGYPNDQHVSADIGVPVCVRSGGTLMLRETISTAAARYDIELAAVSCADGEVRATVRAKAADRNAILDTLSNASAALRIKLGEPQQSVAKFSTRLSQITSSLAAFSSYSSGLVTRKEHGDTLSVPFFTRAIEIDPHFALAYAALAGIYQNLKQPSKAIDCATRAYAERARGNERQRLQITAAYFLATGQIEKELQTYQRWQAVYPLDPVPRNDLGNDYAALGRLEESLREYSAAFNMSPSVLGYTNVGGMYISLDRFDEARKNFADALANNYDGRYIRQNLYWLAFQRGDRAAMQEQVDWARGKAGDEDVLWSMQADTDAYFGRVQLSRAATGHAVESAVSAGVPEAAAFWEVNGALREAELGNMDFARQRVGAALTRSQGREVLLAAALALGRSGDAAGARKLLGQLQASYPNDTLIKYYWLPCIRASIALSERNSRDALAQLQPAEPYELGGAGTFINYLYPAYLRGEAELLNNDGAAAAREFTKLLNHPGIVSNFVTGSLARLQLARAYALAHTQADARRSYESFLGLWTGADADVPVLLQAKSEISRLN